MACWETKLKNEEANVIVESGCRTKTYYGKFWVAQITGGDPKYRFARKFVNGNDCAVLKENGFYQVCRSCPYGEEKYFLKVADGKYAVVEEKDVIIGVGA